MELHVPLIRYLMPQLSSANPKITGAFTPCLQGRLNWGICEIPLRVENMAVKPMSGFIFGGKWEKKNIYLE